MTLPARVALAAAAAGANAYVLFVLVSYGALDGYLDHMESIVAAHAWLFLEGRPLYPEADAPIHFLTTFGPLVYLTNAATLGALGGTIAASKIAGLTAAAVGMGLYSAFAFRAHRRALAAIGVVAFGAIIAMGAPATFWDRGDSMLLPLAVAGLWAIRPGTGRGAAVALGVVMGLAVNLKVHAFVYFLPLLAAHVIATARWRESSVRTAIVGACALAAFLAPFALPGVSLVDYASHLAHLVSASGAEQSLTLFRKVARFSLVYTSPAVPLALLWARGGRPAGQDLAAFAMLVICLILLLYPATKPGAGSHHLLPLAPISIHLFLRFTADSALSARQGVALAALLAIALVAIAVPRQRQLYRQFHGIEARAAGDEVRRLIADPATGSLAMGYGEYLETYPVTFYRPLPIFAGHPPAFEAMTIMELRNLGLGIPDGIVGDIRACRPGAWLVPRGERPFAMPSYHPGKPLFGDDIRTAFHAAYIKARTFEYFDLWTCKAPTN